MDAGVPGPLQRGGVLGERPGVDDGAHEQRQVGRHVTHGQRLDLGDEIVAGAAPERLGQVGAGGRRALLPLVLERAPDQRGGQAAGVRRRVHDHEVLAARLAHQPRVVPVPPDVLADGAPQMLEGGGGAGEVNAGQVGVGQRDLGHRLPVPGDQVDHPGRQPGRLEQAHQVVRRKLLGRRRLPHHHVAEQRGRGRQVTRDRGEVERRDGQHEALERAVLHPVPGAGRRLRLLTEHFSGVVDVVAPEIDQLTGRVDLRLERRLGLPQHGGGVQGSAPRAGQQFRRLEEDRGPVLEGQRPPAGRRLLGRVDRRGHVHVRRVAQLAEHASAAVWLDHVDLLARGHLLLTADGHGEFGLLAREFLDLALQHGPLVAARLVLPDRLVDRHRGPGDGVHHDRSWRSSSVVVTCIVARLAGQVTQC